jgi:hypothetical protein
MISASLNDGRPDNLAALQSSGSLAGHAAAIGGSWTPGSSKPESRAGTWARE